MSFEVPIVFMIFRRPDTTKLVFDRIAEIRPKQLLIVADGPRRDRAGEAEQCQEVRRIATDVNWECEVLTNFAPENLGIRRRVASGLRWAFEHVEQAIIVEDDILPDPSFFPFCQQMLERYREDERVSMISGFNIGADQLTSPESYYFSELCHIWGWATWRRAWALYDENLDAWPAVRDLGLLESVFRERSALRYWTSVFERMHSGVGAWDTWDYQWFFTHLVNHMFSIVPQVNLVQNIGFGVNATHSKKLSAAPKVTVGSLKGPLTHPAVMLPWKKMDLLDQKLSGFRIHSLPVRALYKGLRLLHLQ